MSFSGIFQSSFGFKCPAPDDSTGVSSGTPMASLLTPTPAAKGRVLLIHGYSASGEDLVPWRDALGKSGLNPETIEVGNYISLNNEVTIKDLGEAFDRALRLTKWSSGSKDDSWTFDAIVHSTGMLVLRQWLTSDPFDRDDARSRIRRLKHLVGLAPATFGSPQAKKGRSFLGALVKGNRQLGPDFLNAGDRVLDELELASSYNWELTHKDMLCAKPLYDSSPNTPYVGVFIGNTPYTGIASLVSPAGSDGTVRWAGCALNTRKVSVDFRREPKLLDDNGKPLVDENNTPIRCKLSPWERERIAAPLIAVDGKNHGTIVSDPDQNVVDRVINLFKVADQAAFQAWQDEALAFGANALQKMNADSKKNDQFGGAGWQQLIVHAIDDHGDGLNDYNLQLYIGDDLTQSDDPNFPSIPLDVDTYSGDSSYRCFYIRLSQDMLTLNTPAGSRKKLWIELIASSGSPVLEYEAYTGSPDDPQRLTIIDKSGRAVKLDITHLAQGEQTLLYPFTTTFLEIFVEREPLPLNDVSQLFTFLPRA